MKKKFEKFARLLLLFILNAFKSNKVIKHWGFWKIWSTSMDMNSLFIIACYINLLQTAKVSTTLASVASGRLAAIFVWTNLWKPNYARIRKQIIKL